MLKSEFPENKNLKQAYLGISELLEDGLDGGLGLGNTSWRTLNADLVRHTVVGWQLKE